MKRSSYEAIGVIGMVTTLLSVTLCAEEPAKKAEAVKPPWQRQLLGADAKRAAEQAERLVQLQEAGKFDEALKVAEALVKLRTTTQGADHWEVVDARFEVEAICRVMTANKEEQQNYRRSIGLHREADALLAKGLYQQAQPLFEQILAIRRKVLGERHPKIASSYNNLAYSLSFQGRYDQAGEGYSKALAISRKVLGDEHPDTASYYLNLAANQASQGKYTQAEEGFRKVLAIYAKVCREEHHDIATGYNNLAYSQFAQGKYAQAEEGYKKALAISRRLLGEEHPDTAASYNNLATNQNNQGRYAEAEEGHSKALAITRKVLGEEHPYTATSYFNLAANQYAQGKYPQAEEGYKKALAICLKVLGAEHPNTAACYNNLAANHSAQGKYDQAVEGYKKALAIKRKVLGEEHPDTATGYNNLAVNQNAQGKYDQAEKGYRKALAICLKVMGEEHPDTARAYLNLAFNQSSQGHHVEAQEGFRKALAMYVEVLGKEHPNTATAYNHLAFNQNAQGKYKEAERYWLLGAKVFTKARLHVAASGLERTTKTSELSPLQSLAAVLARNGKPDLAWQRFEESLARGTWDDLSARLRRPQAERDKQTQMTARIDRLNQRINTIIAAKLTEERSKQRDELLSQLRQAYDELVVFDRQLEKEYGPVSGEVFSRSRIQTALAEDTALLAWLDIAGQPKAADPNGEHWAILLRSTGDPIWVRMNGSGEKNAWTDADTQSPAKLRAELLTANGDWQSLALQLRKQRLDPLVQHLKGVHRLIVLPSSALAGVPVEMIADGYTVSYTHSGTMYAHLLRQPAATGKGLFVLADPVFDLPTEKEKSQSLPPSGVLLTFVAPGSNAANAGLKPNDVLLRYGDTDLSEPKDFKPQPESNDPDKRVPVSVWRQGNKLAQPLFVRPGKLGVVFAQEPAPKAVTEQRRLDQALASRSGDNGKWPRLPGTLIEAASLQRLFGSNQSRLLLGSESSEQQLNELAKSGELGKYRYIHLATHGEVNDDYPLRSAVILSCDHLPDDKQRTELLVAGQPIPDGRLEASEVSQRWNLHSDLVTLSACETALGKYERGEGFVGFAQSLILCGTRSVCLSLWKASDTATALLMERFYQNLLGKREGLKEPMPKAAALAEAKTWLRTLTREEAVKSVASLNNGVDRSKRKELPAFGISPAAPTVAAQKSDCPFAHPYYWAAFVLVGHTD